MTTISALREHSIAVLSGAGIRNADVDAELLIGHVLGLSRGRISQLHKEALDALLKRMLQDNPVNLIF